MKLDVKLEREVQNLLGWVGNIQYHILHHEFSFAAELSRDFVRECHRVNKLANALADEESEDE